MSAGARGLLVKRTDLLRIPRDGGRRKGTKVEQDLMNLTELNSTDLVRYLRLVFEMDVYRPLTA